MKITWVQDAKETDVLAIIDEMTTRTANHRPKGSRYVVGEPKSGELDEKGIFFEDLSTFQLI